MNSNDFQLNKYKHKVLTRVNDTTHVFANKGRGTCAMYPLSTLVNNRNKKGSSNLKSLSKSVMQCKQIVRKLKFGHMRNINVNKIIKMRATMWNSMTHDQQQTHAQCGCNNNNVQDM